MKKNYILLLALVVLACKQTKKNNQSIKQNTIVEIPEHLYGKDLEGNEILVGEISYQQMTFYSKDWFNPEYKAYKVNDELVQKIKPLITEKEVILYMGTWCEDSQREVPAMIKILEQVGYSVKNMKIIAVDEDKTTPNQIEKKDDITYVPSLLFFEKGKEINRIVEFPIVSLEQDIYVILNGEAYKNAYAE